MAIIYYTQSPYLAHYGIKRRSGRYPWGSGERPYQSGKGIPKGATVSRISLSENEHMKDIRKYVSVGEMEDKWKDLFTTEYSKKGYENLYMQKYKVKKNLKIATKEENVDLFFEYINEDVSKIFDLPVQIEEFSKKTGMEKNWRSFN